LTVTYDVDLSDIDELNRRLAQYPRMVGEVMQPAMSRSVMLLAGNVKRETPVYQGRLRSSIGGRVESLGGNVRGTVYTNLVYGPPVEMGREPGSFPPVEPLKRWAHLVLGDESLGFVVARAIFRRGTQGRYMFAKGLERSLNAIRSHFARALRELVQKLAGN